uniref:Cytochrome c oxidase subunit 3 n=1 Tax=Radopholus similis TaxID=46012 RepID=E8ZAN7_RADSI|nr:cytochrome c oxidase subunit 3 [Radopholus similis]
MVLYINYHLPHISYYPFMIFFYLMMFFSSVLVFLKNMIYINFLLSFLMIFFLMIIWIKDIIVEGISGFHNFYVMEGFKMGLLLFLFSEFMFFFSIFWFFFDSSLVPLGDFGDNWVPLGMLLVNPFGMPFLNSLILLSSAVTLTWSHYSLIMNNSSLMSLFYTLLLGFYFLLIQMMEYKECFFTLSDSVFGTIFFFGTGFHGLHVFLGLLFLLFNYIRMSLFEFSSIHHLSYEFSILYWHFVDVVWLFLYVFFYYWYY